MVAVYSLGPPGLDHPAPQGGCIQGSVRLNGPVTMGIELDVRVYLEDTDAGGIVYHASYLRFMERARTELLRHAGIEQSSGFEHDSSFVVHSMKLRFHSPARLDDELRVTCRLGEVRRASVLFEQEVLGRHTGQRHVSAAVRVAFIELSSQRPKRLPPELIERMRA